MNQTLNAMISASHMPMPIRRVVGLQRQRLLEFAIGPGQARPGQHGEQLRPSGNRIGRLGAIYLVTPGFNSAGTVGIAGICTKLK